MTMRMWPIRRLWVEGGFRRQGKVLVSQSEMWMKSMLLEGMILRYHDQIKVMKIAYITMRTLSIFLRPSPKISLCSLNEKGSC